MSWASVAFKALSRTLPGKIRLIYGKHMCCPTTSCSKYLLAQFRQIRLQALKVLFLLRCRVHAPWTVVLTAKNVSGEVVRCCHHGPGRMGSYTNKAIRCFTCRNRVSKTHVWYCTVMASPITRQNNFSTQKKHSTINLGTTNESQQMHYITVEICIVPTKRDFPPALHFKGVSSWQFFGSEGLRKHCNDEIMEVFSNFWAKRYKTFRSIWKVWAGNFRGIGKLKVLNWWVLNPQLVAHLLVT